jgi:hypothetical protein
VLACGAGPTRDRGSRGRGVFTETNTCCMNLGTLNVLVTGIVTFLEDARVLDGTALEVGVGAGVLNNVKFLGCARSKQMRKDLIALL